MPFQSAVVKGLSGKYSEKQHLFSTLKEKKRKKLLRVELHHGDAYHKDSNNHHTSQVFLLHFDMLWPS